MHESRIMESDSSVAEVWDIVCLLAGRIILSNSPSLINLVSISDPPPPFVLLILGAVLMSKLSFEYYDKWQTIQFFEQLRTVVFSYV